MPALPEKNVVQKYQMTTEFIEVRRRALSVYLNKVVRARYLLLHTHAKDVTCHGTDESNHLTGDPSHLHKGNCY